MTTIALPRLRARRRRPRRPMPLYVILCVMMTMNAVFGTGSALVAFGVGIYPALLAAIGFVLTGRAPTRVVIVWLRHERIVRLGDFWAMMLGCALLLGSLAWAHSLEWPG